MYSGALVKFMTNGLRMKRGSGILLAYWRILLFHHLLTQKYVLWIVESEVFYICLALYLISHWYLILVFSLHVESVSIHTLPRKLFQFLAAIPFALHAGQVCCTFLYLISILKTLTYIFIFIKEMLTATLNCLPCI